MRPICSGCGFADCRCSEGAGIYPEHLKLERTKTQRQVVGDFIEWLPSRGFVLASYDSRDPDRLNPAGVNTRMLLAAFFDIDLEKIETEKEAIIRSLREMPRHSDETIEEIVVQMKTGLGSEPAVVIDSLEEAPSLVMNFHDKVPSEIVSVSLVHLQYTLECQRAGVRLGPFESILEATHKALMLYEEDPTLFGDVTWRLCLQKADSDDEVAATFYIDSNGFAHPLAKDPL